MNDPRPWVEPGTATLKTGQQLLIRKSAPEDAAAMIGYLNLVGGESDNLLFGKDEFHLTVEQEEAYIQNNRDNPNLLHLLGLVDGEIASIAQISCQNRKRIAHNSEIAISVKKCYWGMGIGNAMMETMIRFAREHGGIRSISLGVKASNANAIRLYEKLGFVQVGIHKDYFNINGCYDDDILMDLHL